MLVAMAGENIDKSILVDLMQVLRSQHKVISYLVANHQATVGTLVNDPALTNFADAFQSRQEYALTHQRVRLLKRFVNCKTRSTQS